MPTRARWRLLWEGQTPDAAYAQEARRGWPLTLETLERCEAGLTAARLALALAEERYRSELAIREQAYSERLTANLEIIAAQAAELAARKIAP